MSRPARNPIRLIIGVLLSIAAFSSCAGGVYLVPSDAYAIQEPFKELGEETTAVVKSKEIVKRSYVAGGRRGGRKTYEERAVVVEMDGGRSITIDDLVLSGDYASLDEGDEVSVTFVRGKKARKALPKGPYYLLTSSVEAGTWSLIPWAFNGRPASGWAIFGFILGLVLLVGGFVMITLSRPAPEEKATTITPASPGHAA